MLPLGRDIHVCIRVRAVIVCIVCVYTDGMGTDSFGYGVKTSVLLHMYLWLSYQLFTKSSCVSCFDHGDGRYILFYIYI